jgi:MinD superfamily P-loop ATPase
MKIAVASGKGGTGKTTVATSLALALVSMETLNGQGKVISFLDCDVEAPNAHIFLKPSFHQQQQVNLLIPEVDASHCTGCGRCAEVCQFHAIVVLGGKTLVFPQLCHGCGSCTLVCPEKAISESPKQMGILDRGPIPETDIAVFARGVLNVGEPMAVPVIAELKTWNRKMEPTLTIIDSPPGTSCPVVESIRGADYVILVTEPTPFGLHDLKLAVQLTDELNIPAGVIINRDGIGNTGVEDFCHETGLPILMQIPFDRKIGEGVAQGNTLVEIYPEYIGQFQTLLNQIEAQLAERKGKL